MQVTQNMPSRSRLNWTVIWRAGLLSAVVLGMLSFLVYQFASGFINHGVTRIGDYYKVDSLQRMSSFPFDQANGTINDVPSTWRALDGKKVIVYGEMWNAQSAGRYTNTFDLVYSISKCCFSGPPQIQHFVHAVPASKDAQVEYFPNLVCVKGTLHVKVTYDQGKVNGVYWLDVDSVEPV